MKKILEKSGESQGILSEEKSGNPVICKSTEKCLMTEILKSKMLVYL